MNIQTVYTLGPAGTHGHQAALIACDRFGINPERSLNFLSSHEEICRQVDRERDAVGVVAVENSIGGLVAEVLAYRLRHYESNPTTSVIGEVFLPITQCLMTLPGLKLRHVSEVLSHPQALTQSRPRLDDILGRHIVTRSVSSTAEAARIVSESRMPLAAIASKLAARQYGLEIKRQDMALAVQNENMTRFHVLRRGDCPRRTGRDRTAVLFRIPNVDGSLVFALETISEAGVNLSSIHSVPLGRMGEFAFYCEFDCHRSDAGMLMNNLHERTESVCVLGSFPQSPVSM